MHKSATKYNETLGKWCKNKHGASKIMDTLETYQHAHSCHRRKMGVLSSMRVAGGPWCFGYDFKCVAVMVV
jgi:hypothetical protein